MNSIFNLLLADDDTDDCIFFREALEELHVSASLTIVNDGVELMQYLTENQTIPHVLYLDLNMPRKNGHECLSEIKSNDLLKRLPVIIYSTSFDPHGVDLLHKQGASYYIRKPADFLDLKKIILKSITLISENKNRLISKDEFVISN